MNLLKTHGCHHKTSIYFVYVVNFKEVAFDKDSTYLECMFEGHSENGLIFNSYCI